MLKREHIKQAVDAIAAREPEIGYVLDEMLGTGRIVAFPPDIPPPSENDFHFLFDQTPATVKRVIFFNEGTVPIEERLLIRYGEMIKKQQLAVKEAEIDFLEAARELRLAGLKFMVNHEIDYAIARLKNLLERPATDSETVSRPSLEEPPIAAGTHDGEKGVAENLIERLETIKTKAAPIDFSARADPGDTARADIFLGWVDGDKPACFVPFPFCVDALMQVADINVEFFHVRFLLDTLMRGLEKNLFACIVDNRIEGLVYLTFKQQFFYRALEIQYIATVRGSPASATIARDRPLRGVGTFLIAGVWLLWKNAESGCREILLDSEVGARQFYETVGFHARGFSEFSLRAPRGPLIIAILSTASRSNRPQNGAVAEMMRIIEKQFKILRSRAASEKKKAARRFALASVKESLRAAALPEFSRAAAGLLMRYRKKIPEADALVRYGIEHGSDETQRLLK